MKKILSSVLATSLMLMGVPAMVMADDAASSANITNEAPTVSSVSINSGAASITLTEYTTTTVQFDAVLSDNNGCGNITGAQPLVFFRTAVGAGAGNNAKNHYSGSLTLDPSSCTGPTDLNVTASGTLAIQYYSDATDGGSGAYSDDDWTAQVTAQEGGTGTNTGTDLIEMSTLVALNVTATIPYGTLALGANTGASDATSTTVTNTGNVRIGSQVDGYGALNGDGYSMTCSSGTITVGNEVYSTSTGVAYGSRTALTDTAANSTLVVPQNGVGTAEQPIYWGFGMPATGVSGACTGTVVFTPINNAV